MNLTDQRKEKYLKKAHDKIKKDYERLKFFIQDYDLSISLDRTEPVKPENIYHVARKMWIADGYEEQSSNFVNFTKKEHRMFDRVMNAT